MDEKGGERRMKMKYVMLLIAAGVFAGWSSMAVAMDGNVHGKVTKIDGEMWTIEMEGGKTKMVHIDPESTKKEGDLKIGAMVSADVTSGGHAKWIKASKMMKDGDRMENDHMDTESMDDMGHE
jgi:hypothetical protein